MRRYWRVLLILALYFSGFSGVAQSQTNPTTTGKRLDPYSDEFVFSQIAGTNAAENEILKQALKFISDFHSTHQRPPIPPGITQSDISNAQYKVIDWQSTLPPKPMNFYGKVVDENGQPVAGATAHFEWEAPVTNRNAMELTEWPKTSTNVTTDAEGLFSLKDTMGIQLDVSVDKARYYSSRTNRGASFFRYSQPNIDTFYGRSDFYKPDSNRPVVYFLRKKGNGANALVTSQRGTREDFSPQVPLDGKPVEVDLLHRKVGDGPLELLQIKPEYANWKTATNWSLTMRMKDGGFVEEEGEFPFNAPESGYQPIASYDFKKGQTNWTDCFKRKFYIKFGNPPVYGQLEVESYIERNSVTLFWVVNTDGSRNLEPQEHYFPSSSRWTH